MRWQCFPNILSTKFVWFQKYSQNSKQNLKGKIDDVHMTAQTMPQEFCIEYYTNIQTEASVKPLFSRHAFCGSLYLAISIRQLSLMSLSACLPGSPSRISFPWHLMIFNHFNNSPVNSASYTISPSRMQFHFSQHLPTRFLVHTSMFTSFKAAFILTAVAATVRKSK